MCTTYERGSVGSHGSPRDFHQLPSDFMGHSFTPDQYRRFIRLKIFYLHFECMVFNLVEFRLLNHREPYKCGNTLTVEIEQGFAKVVGFPFRTWVLRR